MNTHSQNKQSQQQTKKQKLSVKGSKEMANVNVNVNQSHSRSNKSNGSDAIPLHYIILDGLTSSWREFLALHDLGCKVKLLPDILANSVKEMYSTSTPTVTTPRASQEDSYHANDTDTGDYTGTDHNFSRCRYINRNVYMYICVDFNENTFTHIFAGVICVDFNE
jgi:hypothetical protein